jgi:hypothetical protein
MQKKTLQVLPVCWILWLSYQVVEEYNLKHINYKRFKPDFFFLLQICPFSRLLFFEILPAKLFNLWRNMEELEQAFNRLLCSFLFSWRILWKTPKSSSSLPEFLASLAWPETTFSTPTRQSSQTFARFGNIFMIIFFVCYRRWNEIHSFHCTLKLL